MLVYLGQGEVSEKKIKKKGGKKKERKNGKKKSKRNRKLSRSAVEETSPI